MALDVSGQLRVGWFLAAAKNPFSAERRSFGDIWPPYLIPVDVCVPCVLGFGGLLSDRCRISAPVDLIGRTRVWNEEELTDLQR